MKKNQVSNYRSVFLKSNGINKKNAMPVAISPKTYAKIVMGDGSCTVDDFVENVLKHGLSGKESRSISISAATYDMIEGLIHGMETDGCTVDAFVESILKYQLREANTRPIPISPTTYAVIENIIQVMGDGKCTVDDYVKNVLQSKLCEINDVQCIASKA